jgi:predicted deacylase
MVMLEMIDRPPIEGSAVRWVAEDSRPNSGYMQRCYPSPSAGCFETAVELGQPIEAGQVLGVVVDCLGRERHEVRSMQTGRVLVLRTFPAVRLGDSLAVILELDPAALKGA